MPGRRGILPVTNRQPTVVAKGSFRGPALILAADHRARGVITIEAYSSYLGALRAALTHCDGILASVQPLAHLAGTTLRKSAHLPLAQPHRARGLRRSSSTTGSSTTVARAVVDGVHRRQAHDADRHDRTRAHPAPSSCSVGCWRNRVSPASKRSIEAVTWRDGGMARDTDSIVYAAVVAHDMGAPILKVPVPDAEPGRARVEAVGRVVSSVGVPVLFLGGPRPTGSAASAGYVAAGGAEDSAAIRNAVLSEVRDVMTGGAAGLAIGRSLYPRSRTS